MIRQVLSTTSSRVVGGRVNRIFFLPAAASAGSSSSSTSQYHVVGAGPSQSQQQQRRYLGSKLKPPASDPLDLLKKDSAARGLCDTDGGRLPGSHWVFIISTANDSAPNKPPSLRTVHIERCSPFGLDFVMKRSHPAVEVLENGKALSFLHFQGKFLPGEKVEQWRGEGTCKAIPVPEVLDLVPHFTITSMVGSRRFANEQEQLDKLKAEVSEDRLAMINNSHLTEIMQRTRLELENGDISMEELDQSIRAFRLIPDRVECMMGGPDTIMWERWEWLRDPHAVGNASNILSGESIPWNEPKRLVPH